MKNLTRRGNFILHSILLIVIAIIFVVVSRFITGISAIQFLTPYTCGLFVAGYGSYIWEYYGKIKTSSFIC